jgi:hypothetical protein
MAHRRSLGSPGFPVESCDFDQLRVVLLRENHIHGRGREQRSRKSGYARDDKKERVVVGKGRLLEERTGSSTPAQNARYFWLG